MTIYPKLNAHGQASGKYLVEVGKRPNRQRATLTGLAAAQAAEAAMKAGTYQPAPTQAPAASPAVSRGTGRTPVAGAYTVGDLNRECQRLWIGTKDEETSLKRFDAVCELLGASVPLATVRTSALDTVVSALTARDLKPKTVHRYLSAFSAALRWAVTRDKLAGMPTVPWPKVGKGRDTTVTVEEEQRVLAWLYKKDHPDVALIVDVLLATGCRVGELLALEVPDIGEESITFRDTKNGDDRTVPLEPALADKLARLVAAGLPTYPRINWVLRKAGKALGIPHSVTPHVWRHTVGTRLDANGVSVKTIGAILGHRSPGTTLAYIHPEAKTIKEAAKGLRRGTVPSV